MIGKKKITGSLEVSGSIVSIEEPLVVETKNILWADLVALRDASELIPGQQYRITDYVTTTVQENTRSAGYQFDIIVTADDIDKLNENARAVQHEVSTDGELLSWFEHNQSDPVERYFYVDSVVIEGLTLYRWLSYEELANDDGQYLLTDKREVGIGDVVWGYQIIDDSEIHDTHSNYEEGDEQLRTIINVGEGYMPGYDYFYNSKLEAWQLKYCLDNDTSRFAWADSVNGKGVIYRMIDEFNNDCPYDFKNIMFYHSVDELYYYTFTVYDDGDTEDIVDVSTIQNRFKNDENGYSAVSGNTIKPWLQGPFNDDIGEYSYISIKLNEIMFINKTSYDHFYGIEGNIFGLNCYRNTFGVDCSNNTFGVDCSNNTFGNYCSNNTFGDGCYRNTFGNYCSNNTFGNYCYSNTFGDGCYDDIFGNNCYSNTFGNDCYSNTFGNDCRYNTFGNNCYSNTFGNYCSNNTFGNDCRYLKISDVSTTQKKYIHVENGMQGASFNNKFELYDPAILNKEYQVTFKKSASGKYLMLWATDTGTMTGKVKDSNIDNTWEDIV